MILFFFFFAIIVSCSYNKSHEHISNLKTRLDTWENASHLCNDNHFMSILYNTKVVYNNTTRTI